MRLSHPTYRPDIDGLRAVAVLAVVIYHAFPERIPGGFVGVDVFFVISGFLISSIILQSLQRGTFSFLEFYARRVARIFPALLVVLTSCFVFGWQALYAEEFAQLGKHVASGASFFSNLVLWSEVGYFDNSVETKPLLHLWSLGIEEQFYIIWPLVLWFSWRMRTSSLWPIVVVALASFLLNVYLVERDAVNAFYSPLTRFWELAAGSLLAWYRLPRNETVFAKWPDGSQLMGLKWATSISGRHRGAFHALISCAGLLMLAWSFWTTESAGFPGVQALLPVMGAFCLIAAGTGTWLNRFILSNKLAVWFGLISFPLYLWHWPLLSFARIVEGETPSAPIRLAAVTVAIALAWITFQWIEQPIRRRGPTRGIVMSLLVLMVVAGTLGFAVFRLDGLPERSSMLKAEGQRQDLKFKLEKMSGWLCDGLEYERARCHYTGSNPSVVVVGDSHAPRIYAGLREHYASKGMDLAVYGGGGGCPPLLNVVSKISRTEHGRNCVERITRSMQTVMDTPSITHVILASRGPLYTTSNGFGDIDGDRYGHWVLHFDSEPQGIRSNEEVFSMALANTLDALLAAGKQVTYLYDVPELGFDVKSCMERRPFSMTGKKRTPCSVPKKDFMERNKAFREMADNILKERPEVHVVDLATALCDEHYCYGALDGTLFYTDDDHLSHKGAAYVVQQLASEFR